MCGSTARRRCGASEKFHFAFAALGARSEGIVSDEPPRCQHRRFTSMPLQHSRLARRYPTISLPVTMLAPGTSHEPTKRRLLAWHHSRPVGRLLPPLRLYGEIHL
jgi:hypothetical protein